MAWLPSHQSLARHPKLQRLMGRLQIGQPAAIGHLHLLWYWALEYAPSGALARWDDEVLALAAGWEGEASAFRAALVEAGFMDADGRLHDWQDYGGGLVLRRARDAARKRQARTPEVRADESAGNEAVRAVPAATPPPPTSAALVEAYCRASGIALADLSAREREKNFVAAAALLKAVPPPTPEEVAAYFAATLRACPLAHLGTMALQLTRWRASVRRGDERSVGLRAPRTASPRPTPADRAREHLERFGGANGAGRGNGAGVREFGVLPAVTAPGGDDRGVYPRVRAG